ncbi:PTS transporter subunit EIIC [Klebsiella michiganensis]|uniref:PTS transporter subunit EIIC n=1 Tax=Klebsiella TaxID=570 RepID=UPI000DE651AD|nr:MULTISPECIES: PTS transporter subunit EIIC [Klebsiella]MEB6370935.1 PTS transporter subunit EIIC [Klebsiella michiganensis]UXO79609.1 PTS transporter subunit EIIC [Klebsiella michiganensis]SSG25514.1 PTS system beta-glucoside-specific transporter subunit IIABC [Klebsiella pneumoniae]HBZ7326264.1 PTS transporter subunit EIIC [Klebsiella pneumoniae]HBZ7351969.1 PTS transporter subunit EIIC [Klebsiella pneumoniae]
MNYVTTSSEILAIIGGKDNVQSFNHCATRLRIVLRDMVGYDKEKLQAVDGVIAVVESAGQLQIVIGNEVNYIYVEISKLLGHATTSYEPSDEKSSKEKANIIDIVSSIFTPVLGVLLASGILKGLLILLSTLGWLDQTSGTYVLFNAASDSFFFFLPVMLGYTATKKFGGNPFVGMAIGGALVHPSILAQFSITEGDTSDMVFLGVPIVFINYAFSVIPIIIASFFSSKLENIIESWLPSSVRRFMVPAISIAVITPLTFLFIGPAATWLSHLLSDSYQAIYQVSSTMAGVVMGGLWQVAVIFGLHWGLIPLMLNNFAVLGHDTMTPMIIPAFLGQAGAVFAVMLKARDVKMKSLAGSSLPGGIIGITEPIIYGVTLPLRTPFIFGCIGGAVGGGVIGYFQTTMWSFGLPTIFAFTQFIPEGGFDASFYGSIAAAILAFVISSSLTFALSKVTLKK